MPDVATLMLVAVIVLAHLATLLSMARAAGVPARQIGRVGGDRIRISIDGRRVLDESAASAEGIWATSIEAHFERRRAIA